jgi:ABC-type antimicrobial peptide transport system permease subunit
MSQAISHAPSRWQRIWDSDVAYSFRTSPVAMVAAAVALVCVFCSAFAGWVAPHNPFDLATLELSDARLPPAWYPKAAASTCWAPTIRGVTFCRH